MRSPLIAASFAFLVTMVSTAGAQVAAYGSSTPNGFTGALNSDGQIPYVSNLNFHLHIGGNQNPNGGAFFISGTPATIQAGNLFIWVDLTAPQIVPLAPNQTDIPLPLANVPGLAGLAGFGQVVLFDNTVPGGYGLTNGILVQVMPNRQPSRAYIPGQDFSNGASAPGNLEVLDLSVTPPILRASGSIAFNGNIGNNYSTKVTVAHGSGFAYAFGTDVVNQVIRILNIGADPTGIAAWPIAGDIPLPATNGGIAGEQDLATIESGQLLFVTTRSAPNSASAELRVYDTTTVPSFIPTAPILTFPLGSVAGEPMQMDVSPDESRLALMCGGNSGQILRIYCIFPGTATPLALVGSVSVPGYSSYWAPHDVKFSPDGRQIMVSAAGGQFSIYDISSGTPIPLLSQAIWSATQPNGLSHGAAYATSLGRTVGVFADEGATSPLYHVLDLAPGSPTFGMEITSFSTNGTANISNHRMEGRQNIVLALDDTGATNDAQWMDIINLDLPTSPGGFVFYRVKTASATSLTPGSYASIPRDFGIF